MRYIALAIGGGLMAAGGSSHWLSLAPSPWHHRRARLSRHRHRYFWQLGPYPRDGRRLDYGGAYALQLRLQAMGLQLPIPYETFLALPYIVTIIALVIAGRNRSYPTALLKPYHRE